MDEKNLADLGLASELRQSAGAEWQAEAAEDEQLTELQRQRNATLSDLAKEMANRGDRTNADFGGHNFSGVVIGAGTDYVVISGSGQIAEIRLDTATWGILNADGPRVDPISAPESFRASLHQHSTSGSPVRLMLHEEEMLIGRVGVVAGDHVVLIDADERSIWVPFEMILGVIHSDDRL